MILQLHYSETILHPSSAAFIRGTSPYDWLKEISNWNIDIEDLECYILPYSIENISPAGLFVIFKKGIFPKQYYPLDTYGEIAKGIYVPVRSVLTPATTGEELKKICLWELQVFHPTIGLIGFETKDQVNLVDLINTGFSTGADWSFAHPGIPAKPAFTQINILQPSVQDIMDDFKKDIDTKPLAEIPKDKKQKTGWLYKLWDRIKWIIFLILLFIARLFNKILPKPANTSISSSNKDKPGLFGKLEQWINRNLEELEKKRDSELKRLLKLFDENTDEALQYAIPLDSPYMNRGKAPQSETLSRRPFNFNLGKLGGGGAADIWDVGHHYNDLRTKYIKAAQKEIERKDFKKAAYIYAHLLGDYYGAANALEQGQYYREAAALYKDHLKNIPAAAECLERGGLFLEAIELYKQLQQHEKIGDLYDTISRKTDAESYYEQTIELKLQNNDYLDAGRVIKDKLRNSGRAKQTLLSGWNNEKQSENCLKNYFDLVRETENEIIEQKVQEVYKQHTPKQKKKKFLEVLKHVYNRKKDIQEQDSYQHIAYEITSEQAEEGNLYALNDLSHFFSDDELISSDCSRYIHNKRNQLQEKRSLDVFHLDAGIKWQKAAWQRNQFLVAGVKNGVLHLARCSWDQHIEYYSWTNPIKPNTYFRFINSPYYSSHIILHSYDGLPVTRKNLLKNKYFQDALIINCPIWLQKRKNQFIINDQNEIVLLDAENSSATLHYYTMDGELKRSVNCRLDSDEMSFTLPLSNTLMVNRDGYYYTYFSKVFFSIDENGSVKYFSFPSVIRNFAISQPYTTLWIIISTNQGCILCKPSKGKLNPIGDIFASEFTPASTVFIATDLFVLVEKKRAILFHIQNEIPKLLREFETHATIISAMPSSNRDRFVLLEETGRITFGETGI
jgi:hypothetical protein